MKIDLFTKKDLKAKITLGSFLLGGGSGFEQAFRLLRNIILTRLIAPDVFGIMAIMLSINSALESFTELGIRQAIIQNPKGKEKEYLNGAWWLAFTRASLLCLVSLFLCPYVTDFYNITEFTTVMRLILISILMNGLINPGLYATLKDLNYSRWVLISNGGSILGISATIILAFIIPGIWALAIGFVSESFFRVTSSYIFVSFRPSFGINKKLLYELYNYTKGMVGLPILYFIFQRADVFVLGKFIDKFELGLYTVALTLTQIPITFMSQIFGHIATPLFSSLQRDKTKLADAFTKIISGLLFLFCPLLMFAIFYSKDLLMLVYGKDYGNIAIPFAIVFSTATLQACSTPIASFYFGTGHPQLHRIFAIIRTAMLLTLIIPAVKWYGTTGAAVAGSISMITAFMFQLNRVRQIISFDFREYGKLVFKSLLMSMCVPFVWLISNAFKLDMNNANILFGFLGCFISYVIIYYVLIRTESIFRGVLEKNITLT